MTPPTARRMPAEVGVWVFLLADMGMFAVMFGVLVWLRDRDPASYHAAQEHLHTGLGAVNTVLLLTGSLLVALGVRATRDARRDVAPRLFAGAIGCAVVFAGVKALEWRDLAVGGHSPASGDFCLYFFSFTGVHLAHVVIGIVVLAGVARLARRPRLDGHEIMLVESGASYWHMVDLLWLALFALLYLVR